ncbi:hypothetical protein CANINC_003691 [Pichia inconspicua]|uniref:Zn(2)-C6 fungal-type domain-containing protein n=1 Tax=Pichia inconspicua TaxID=52247 RepID=A0A4V4NFD7_9ASCO|nr:hypothetical protein CANINC_003691 [[Candida] inconspicua]
MSARPTKRLQSTRRLVPSDRRKRALFSCDRCKLRKTKCNRIQNNDLKYDNITPCLQCTKAGVSCTTSIPRKKRFYGPVKNITLHYKCLLALASGLFPDADIYNIDELIEIGHKLKFEMPNIDSEVEEMEKSEREALARLENESNLIDSKESEVESEVKSENQNSIPSKPNATINNSSDQHKLKPEVENDERDFSTVTKSSIPESSDDKIPKLPPGFRLKQKNVDNERLIMDKFGHTHFIGNFGTASLLNGLCDIIIKRSYNQNNPPTSTQDIRDSSVQTITSEAAPVYHYPTQVFNIDNINVDRFPLINLVDKEEADVYVKVFFEKIHPYYFIFNQNKFKEKYDLFWEELKINLKTNSKSTILRISGAEICTIYTIWILGRRFLKYSEPEHLPHNAILDDEAIGNLIDIIKLSLSDVVLTPSIDGIRLLFLFSVYLSSIKVRESGYCLMELAAIQAKSLGLHRKSIVNKFNEEKSDVMKRIMWSLGKAETSLCCSFGRASAIPWEEIDIGLPEITDVTDEHFKIFYFQSCRLTKIIFEILDYKKKAQKDPLSLTSTEKALYFKKKLENFWDNIPESWKDYKSLPIKRYKPKLHIQYHYYFITLTLPMFLYISSSHNYIVKNDDPFLSLLVCGIKSSFKTAEIISYTDSKGFFNGTLYYDVFYCYNAIMVLTLTYILFKSSKAGKVKSIIDLENLNDKYGINLDGILASINLIRKLVLNNLHQIDGTMKRMCDIIETLLEDLGIIQTLVLKFNAPKSNAKKIENKNESGSSVSSIPVGFSKVKLQFNRINQNKRRKVNKGRKIFSASPAFENEIDRTQEMKVEEGISLDRSISQPLNETRDVVLDMSRSLSSNTELYQLSQNEYLKLSSEDSNSWNKQKSDHDLEPYSIVSSDNSNIAQFLKYPNEDVTVAPYHNLDDIDLFQSSENMSSSDINGVLSSMSLNTDLMDALFGSTDLFNSEGFITKWLIFSTNKSKVQKTKKQKQAEIVDVPKPTPLYITAEDVKTRDDRPWRPFRWPYHQTMSIFKLDINNWLDMDKYYYDYIKEKERVIHTYGPDNFDWLPGSEDACRELMDTVKEHMMLRYPLLFTTKDNGTLVKNELTGEILDFSEPLKEHPLVYVSKMAKEDFYIVMQGEDGTHRLVAAAVPFPGGSFGIKYKLGKSLDVIHTEVPYYKEKLKPSMERWFARMKPEDLVERASWYISWDHKLLLNNVYALKARDKVDKDVLPTEFNVRVERQTLRRLPKTKAIIFTNHPVFYSIDEMKDEPLVPSLIRKIIFEAPEGICKYKNFESFRDHILPYLNSLVERQINLGLITEDTPLKTLPTYPFASFLKDSNPEAGWSNPKYPVNYSEAFKAEIEGATKLEEETFARSAKVGNQIFS